MRGPTPEQLMDLQNHVSAMVETGIGAQLKREDLCVISWALGVATAHALPRRRDRPRPGEEPEITWTDRSLHLALDMLMAEYIKETNTPPSKTSVLELLEWSHARLERKGGV